MAITRESTIAPQSGQPQQVRVMVAICDACLGLVLDLWGCNLSPSPLVQQYRSQWASRTPSRYIINNGCPIVQRILGCHGAIIHWVKLGGKSSCHLHTGQNHLNKQTNNVQNNSNACDGLLLQSTSLTHQCPMPQCNASMQCLNAMPQRSALCTNASM